MDTTTPILTPTIDVRVLPAMRRRLGWTQTELARRIGCRPEEVTRVEASLRPGGVLDRIMAALYLPTVTTDGEPQN